MPNISFSCLFCKDRQHHYAKQMWNYNSCAVYTILNWFLKHQGDAIYLSSHSFQMRKWCFPTSYLLEHSYDPAFWGEELPNSWQTPPALDKSNQALWKSEAERNQNGLVFWMQNTICASDGLVPKDQKGQKLGLRWLWQPRTQFQITTFRTRKHCQN